MGHLWGSEATKMTAIDQKETRNNRLKSLKTTGLVIGFIIISILLALDFAWLLGEIGLVRFLSSPRYYSGQVVAHVPTEDKAITSISIKALMPTVLLFLLAPVWHDIYSKLKILFKTGKKRPRSRIKRH